MPIPRNSQRSFEFYEERETKFVACRVGRATFYNTKFILLRRMPKVVWSVGSFWSLPATGIILEGKLEFTTRPLNSIVHLALVMITI
jgi:hypothetical protein